MAPRFSIRFVLVVGVAFGALALAPFSDAPVPDFGASLPGLTADQLSRFQAGKAEFLQVETISEGVGPVFNDFSCANCHSVPAVGGSSTRVETRFGTLTPSGQFDPLTQYGGSLIQSQGIGYSETCTYVAETVPTQATIVAGRRTTHRRTRA
jgi:hypothetical protein